MGARVTVWEAVTRKFQGWKAGRGPGWERAARGGPFSLSSITCTDLPPICLCPALGPCSCDAGLVFKGGTEKQQEEKEHVLLPEEARPERSIMVRTPRELCKSWGLAPSRLTWDHQRPPMQIYLRAFIVPSHPPASAETCPWPQASPSREL